jgi:hypothetical protein
MHRETMELDDLLSRLERVEKENRRVKRITITGLLVLSSAFFMGQARPSRTIEAEKFVVKDSNGKVRGEFGMESYFFREFTFGSL